jgi:glutathione synthase/RimK-type ligase-like ATP-grasp enzyme
MMNYLLYSNAGSTTGKALLEALKTKGANLNGGMKDPGKVSILLRWGSMLPVDANPGKVWNSKAAITKASNKEAALQIFKENGIKIPKTVVGIQGFQAEDFPVLGRKAHHVAGNDIILCLQRSDLDEAAKLGCTHYTKYIPTKTEFRIHVWGDQIIKISEKVLTEPERHKDSWIRNFDEGYTFVSPKTHLPAQTKGMAIDAVACLGLHFGAVDMILGDDGLAYVLEVNTAPGLQTDSSIEAYVNKFMEVLA